MAKSTDFSFLNKVNIDVYKYTKIVNPSRLRPHAIWSRSVLFAYINYHMNQILHRPRSHSAEVQIEIYLCGSYIPLGYFFSEKVTVSPTYHFTLGTDWLLKIGTSTFGAFTYLVTHMYINDPYPD